MRISVFMIHLLILAQGRNSIAAFVHNRKGTNGGSVWRDITAAQR